MIFMDESCKRGKIYLDSYNLWVICSAISAFWIAVFGLIILGIAVYALCRVLYNAGMNTFRPRYLIYFISAHCICFESMVNFN